MAEREGPAEGAGAEAPAPEAAASAPPLLGRLCERFGDAILATHCFRGDATAIVKPEALLDVCRWLRDDGEAAFDLLLDVTAVDFLGRAPRFEVVYHLLSLSRNERLRLKVPLEESAPQVPSLVPVWKGANWLERETWDMYGIVFQGHPDLRRIYLYEEFEGHPLRKDYPKERRQPLIGPGAPAREGAVASERGSGGIPGGAAGRKG